MTEKKRILFISHHGTMSGAPISLLTLMRHFAANRDWEFQVLMRKEGPLRSTGQQRSRSARSRWQRS